MKKKNTILLLLILIICIILFIVFSTKHSKTEKPQANIIEMTPTNTQSENTVINYEAIENSSIEKKYAKYDINYPDYFRTDINEKSLNILVKDSAVDIILKSNMKIKANEFYPVIGINKNIKDVSILPILSADNIPIMFVIFEDNTVGYIDIETAFKTGTFVLSTTNSISSLTNIEKIVNVEVEEENKKYIGIIAIDSSNNSKEITPEMLGISK